MFSGVSGLLRFLKTSLLCFRKKLFDHLLTIFASPVPIANCKSHNFTLRAYKKTYRDSRDTILGCYHRLGIKEIQECQTEAFDKFFHQLYYSRVLSLVNRDGYNSETFFTVQAMDFFQRGPLLAAIRSPGSPEIQQHKLPAKLLQAPHFPF